MIIEETRAVLNNLNHQSPPPTANHKYSSGFCRGQDEVGGLIGGDMRDIRN